MISVEIVTNEYGMITGCRVAGHSGTAERGEDIVCAGVSALTQSALLGIIASGNLEIRLQEPPDDCTEAILRTMYMGLAEIEKISPKGIRIQEVKG